MYPLTNVPLTIKKKKIKAVSICYPQAEFPEVSTQLLTRKECNECLWNKRTKTSTFYAQTSKVKDATGNLKF